MADQPNQKLQLYLARCGIGSRRRCEKYISQGLVSVNDTIITSQGLRVTNSDVIKYKENPVYPIKQNTYIALYKPKGYVCTNSDPQNRPQAIDLLYANKNINTRLFHVGRLDMLSSGLILFSNDGLFTKIVTHPSYCIEKEYFISSRKTIPESFLKQFQQGIVIDNIQYKCISYFVYNKNQVRIILQEGKNREIRRVFDYGSIPIKELCRFRIGPITLEPLKPKEYRFLSSSEVSYFLQKEQKKVK